MKLNIKILLNQLLLQEDTDNDKKITIEDKGPKLFKINELEIKGTYALSNLLQELVWAEKEGKTEIEITQNFIDEVLNQEPKARISKMIREKYWDGLTRTIDEKGLSKITEDTKSNSKEVTIYVPYTDNLALNYFASLQEKFKIKVVQLPENITPQWVLEQNENPGILSLKLQQIKGSIKGVPFVVPGGRFNEMYGWDSYFQNIGLLIDEKVELAKSVVENFQYQIEHYGKILNANRSYYLTRTQPPFFSSMIREVYEKLPKNSENKEWLSSMLSTCIKEYQMVWMVEGKRNIKGLNRYLAEGIGIPPETEEGHYDAILFPFAKKWNLTIEELEEKYRKREISIPELDEYFIHDRSVRESGHDTTYRFEGICADILPVELNCMLYKYEKDITFLIHTEFNNSFQNNTAENWEEKAKNRKNLIQNLMWNQDDGMFWDYNFKQKKQHKYLAASCFFPLWVEIPTKEQAEKMIKNLQKITTKGGIAGSDEISRGLIHVERPERQWDFPNGWAPHQMIIWQGLLNYGYTDIAKDLINRWIDMITQNAVHYNGTIPEKYNVVEATHKVFAEYGNVGTEFEYITTEGFGWMNASYQLGLKLLQKLDSNK